MEPGDGTPASPFRAPEAWGLPLLLPPQRTPGPAPVGYRQEGQVVGAAPRNPGFLPSRGSPGAGDPSERLQQRHRWGRQRACGPVAGLSLPWTCLSPWGPGGWDPPSPQLLLVGLAGPDTPRSHSPWMLSRRVGWGGRLTPGSAGTGLSCTALMTCLPTMMPRSSWASSARWPPAARCSVRPSG